MKNSVTIFCAVSLLIFVGLGCKNNPLAKFTNQYRCTIEGEPEPQTAEDYLKRAGKHMENNNYSADFDQCAFDAISDAVRLDPQNIEAVAMRGFLYKARAKMNNERGDSEAAKEDFQSALDDMNQAISAYPDRDLYYDVRSSICRESDILDPDSEKALQDLTKAIELSSSERSTISYYEKRSDIYVDKKDYENAVKDYSEAIKLDPKKSEFYAKRSEAYGKLGKMDLANADSEKQSELEKGVVENTPDKIEPETPNSNKKDAPKTISGGVLNGKAIDLPKPVYPAAAQAVKASGAVNVQVTVNEKGEVVSASAVSGHPLLRTSAESAARSAKFKPTLLSGEPVKVSGVIVYNFVP